MDVSEIRDIINTLDGVEAKTSQSLSNPPLACGYYIPAGAIVEFVEKIEAANRSKTKFGSVARLLAEIQAETQAKFARDYAKFCEGAFVRKAVATNDFASVEDVIAYIETHRRAWGFAPERLTLTDSTYQKVEAYLVQLGEHGVGPTTEISFLGTQIYFEFDRDKVT